MSHLSAARPRPRLLILSFSPIVNDARVLKQVEEFREDYEVTTCGYGEAPAGYRATSGSPTTSRTTCSMTGSSVPSSTARSTGRCGRSSGSRKPAAW
ncbi:hypothetical protein NKG05_20820 [Oerskovia sp. M15]